MQCIPGSLDFCFMGLCSSLRQKQQQQQQKPGKPLAHFLEAPETSCRRKCSGQQFRACRWGEGCVMRLRTAGRVKGFSGWPVSVLQAGLWRSRHHLLQPGLFSRLPAQCSWCVTPCAQVGPGLSPEAVPCHSGKRALLSEDLLLTALCQFFLLSWDQ